MKPGGVEFLNQKSLNSYFQTRKGCKPQEVLCWDKVLRLSYVVIQHTSELFSHTQTQHVRALAVHIRCGPTSRRLAAAGLGLMVWSQHAGCTRGSVLHCIAGMLSVFVWPERLGASR